MDKQSGTLEGDFHPSKFIDGLDIIISNLTDALILLNRDNEKESIRMLEDSLDLIERLQESHEKSSYDIQGISDDTELLRMDIKGIRNTILYKKGSKREIENSISELKDQLVEVANYLENNDNYLENNEYEIKDRMDDFAKELGHVRTKIGEFESTQDEIETVYKKVENLQEEIDKDRGRIDEVTNRITEKEETLDKKLNELTEKEEDIKETEEQLEELRETASNLVKSQAGESIGGHFENRKEDLKKAVRWWKYGSVISIISLIGFSIGIYFDISSSPSQNLIAISKIALILPVSVAVWFSVSNYSRQKKLMQEYEFKANMALSLMGFREVVKEDIPADEQVKVGEFVIDSMDKVYSNPQENISTTDDPVDQNTPLTTGQASLVELYKRLNK